MKGINIPPHARITVDVQRPHTVIEPVDESGDMGILDGFGVMIVAPGGRIIEQRAASPECQRQHQMGPLESGVLAGLCLLGLLHPPLPADAN